MALPISRQFMEAVTKSNRTLITFRKDWSVDAVAAALALGILLEQKGKKADIAADLFAAPAALLWLPKIGDIKPSLSQLQKFVISLDVSKTKLDELTYDLEGDKLKISATPKSGMYTAKDVGAAVSDFKYDLVIAVDTPDYNSLGALFSVNTDFFFHQPVINIDSESGNEQYGNINIVEIAATSCSEIIYKLFKNEAQGFLSEDVATCLLAGMISKTRCFKTSSVTPKTLEIASELVAAGGRREEIIQNLYRTRSLSTLKLWGRALARLKYDPHAKIAWTLLLRQDFVHAGAAEEYLPDVIDELIVNSPQAEIIALMYEQESATEKGRVAGICSLVSSEKHGDALGLVGSLRPEGNRRMARVCFPGTSIMEAEKAVLNAIYKSLGKARQDVPAILPLKSLRNLEA